MQRTKDVLETRFWKNGEVACRKHSLPYNVYGREKKIYLFGDTKDDLIAYNRADNNHHLTLSDERMTCLRLQNVKAGISTCFQILTETYYGDGTSTCLLQSSRILLQN